MSQYRVLPGPEHFLPPAAASMGIQLPNPGEAHINGVIVSEDKAYEEAAKQFLEFIKGSPGQEIMKRYGFTLPN